MNSVIITDHTILERQNQRVFPHDRTVFAFTFNPFNMFRTGGLQLSARFKRDEALVGVAMHFPRNL